MANGEHLVSIITPCYNGERYLPRFFQSIIDQTYRPLELIFVNDGSTDQTSAVAAEYGEKFNKSGVRFHYFEQANAGQASAVNRGLKLAEGEFISLIDSDDSVSPDFIRTKARYLLEHPGTAFCYGPAIEITDDEEKKQLRSFGKRDISKDRSFFEDVLNSRDVFFSGYLFRSDALDAAIPQREIYSGRGGQNAQLLLPMGWYYGEPAFVEGAVYTYYNHADSHSHCSLCSDEKMIDLLYSYEAIMTETVKRIPDPNAQTVLPGLKKRYARLRFGHALNTKDSSIVKRGIKELKNCDELQKRDIYLAFRYTNRLVNLFFPVD